MYIKGIKIKKILPCIADATKIRFHAELDKDITELMPYLNRIISGAIYVHNSHTLTLKKDGALITLYPKEIHAGQVLNENTAYKICDWIKEQINYVYENKERIKPLYERRQQLTVLKVYKFLPQKNCKKCGEETCLAFAVKLLSEEKNVLSCTELFDDKYKKQREELFNILKTYGYLVSKVFK